MIIHEIEDSRDNILHELNRIGSLLSKYYPDQYDKWYQHIYPQIVTALDKETEWLPRGQFNLQNIIDHINDDSYSSGGVSKYIGDKNV
jgi:hypothetical protein